MSKTRSWFNRSRIILIVFFIASTAIIALGLSYYFKQKHELQQKIEEELTSIAELKASEIETWLKEKKGDAFVIANSPNTFERFRNLVNHFNQADYLALSKKIEVVKEQYGYEDIFLVDTLGNVKVSTKGSTEILSKETLTNLDKIKTKDTTLILELYFCRLCKRIHFDIVTTFKDPNNSKKKFGFVILRSNPHNYLFPLIKKWPTKSKTAETVLVRKERDSVVFMNDVRHYEDASLKIRIPLTKTDVAAVKAVNGFEGFSSGIDYRGIKVLFYSVRIKNTPWSMIAKVDTDEVSQPIRTQGWQYGLGMILTISMLFLLVILIRNSDQRRYIKRLLEMEVERKILISHYEYLVKNANDIIILANDLGAVVEANQSALNAYQRDDADIKKCRLSELGDFNFIPGKKNKNQTLSDKPYEAIHKRKNGERFPVEISEKYVEFEGIRYYQAIVRDITERKQNETELKEKEVQYRNLADSGLALIWTSDINKKCDYFNEPWLKFTGRTLEQELGDGWAEGVHPDDLQYCYKTYVDAFDARRPFAMEYRLRNTSGEYRWIRDLGQPNYNSKGEFIGYIGHCFDITERKLIEQKLQENETRLSLIFNTSPVGIVITRPEDGFIVDSNKAYSQIFGYEPHEIIGKSTIELNLWVDLLDRNQINKAVSEAGMVKNFETWVRKKDGEIRCVEGNVERIEISGKLYNLSLINDITERKQAEERLRASEEKWHNLFEILPVGVSIVTPENEVIESNNALARILDISQDGLTAGEYRTRRYFRTDNTLMPYEEFPSLLALKEQKTIRDVEIGIEKEDGSRIWTSVSAAPLTAMGETVTVTVDITAHKLADERLRESEERLSLVMEGSQLGYWDWNIDTGEVHRNARWAEMLGYTLEEIQQSVKQWTDLHHPDDKEAAMKSIQDHLEGNTIGHRIEYRLRAKDGQYKWILDQAKIVKRDANGKPLRMSGTHTDITERKQSEIAIKESEKRFATLFRSNPTPIGITNDSDYRIFDVNDAWCKLTGYSREEAIGHNSTELGLAKPQTLDLVNTILQTNCEVPQTEIQLYTRSGEERHVLINAEKMEIGGKKYVLNSLIDFTEHKTFERKIQESETKFRSFFENSMDAILFSSPDGKIFAANHAACRMFGYTEDELCEIGRNGLVDTTDPHLHEFLKEREEKGYASRELTMIRKDGTHFPVEITSSIFDIWDGDARTNLVIRDITEKKITHERLRESEARFRGVYENASIGIYRTTPEGAILMANPAILKMLGYNSFDEVSSFNLEDTEHYSHDKIRKEFKDKVEKEGEIIGYESNWIRKDGTAFYGRENAKAIRDESGKILYYEGSVEDITEFKKAENALIESEIFARSTLNGLSAHIAIIDYTGQIIAVNTAWRKFAENNSPLLSNVNEGANYLEVCDNATGDDESIAKEASRAIRNILAGVDDTTEIEYACHSSKEQRWFIARISKFPGEGNPKVVIAHENITELKKVENALIQSEETHRLLFDHNPIPMWVYELETLKFLRVNEFAIQKYGYTQDEFMVMTLKDIRPLEEIQLLVENVTTIGNEKIQRSGVWKHKRKNGEIILVEIHSHSMNFEGRNARLVAAYDITERIENENKIKKSEERFRSTLENMIEGCQIIDYDWRYIYINHAGESQNQRPNSELIGNKYSDMWPGVESTEMYQKMKSCMEERIAYTFENEFIFPNGNIGWYDLSIQPVPEGIFILSVDITQEKNAQESIKQKDELLRLTGFMAKVGGWEFDLKTKKGYWTDEVYHIYDLDPAIEPTIEVGLKFYNPKSQSIIEKAVTNAIKDDKPYDLELELTSAKGVEKWVRTIGYPIKVDNRVVQMKGIIQDITVQIKANERLRQSEDRFRTLVESAPEAIYIQTDSKFSYLNPAAVKLFKAESIYNLLGKSVLDFFHPDFREQVKQRIHSLNKLKNTIPNTEERCITLTGEEFHVEVSAVPFNYEQKNGALVFMHDITERKIAEQNLKRSEEQFIRAFHANPIGLQISTVKDGKIVEVNEAYCKIYGFEKEELIGKTVLKLGLYQNPEERKPIVELLKKQGFVRDIEVNFKTKKGESRILLGSLEPIVFNDQECLISFVIDITERKTIENEIKRINADLEIRVKERTAEVLDLYNNAPCGYHSLDSNGVFLFINDTELNWLGYQREEVVGKLKVTDLLSDESKKVFAKNFPIYKKTGILNDLEMVFVRRDGTQIPILLSATAIFDENHNFVMSRSTAIDNTNLKQAKDEIIKAKEGLEVANKELEAFSYTVSHDLRAPLRAIHGFIQILEEDYTKILDEEGVRVMKVIQDNTSRMAQLIDDLLAFSRITRTEIQQTPIDTHALVASIQNELLEGAQREKFKFIIKDLPRTIGDKNLMTQVWKNLIGNAIKYSSKKENPEIEIGYLDKDNEYEFYIKDNGAGFDMAYYDKLFEVFQRLHPFKEFEGSGVGLAIVQRIISRHGGNIYAVGEIDKGATFFFTIPK